MMSKRFPLAILMALLLFAAAWSGWWYYSASTARHLLQGWTEDQRAQGFDIAYERADLSGYPLNVTLTILGFQAAAPDSAWHFSGEKMVVSFPAWRPDRYTLNSVGPVQASATAIPGSTERPISAGELLGDYSLTDRTLRLLTRRVSGPMGVEIREFGFTGIDTPDGYLARLEAVDGHFPNWIPQTLPQHISAAILGFRLDRSFPYDGSGDPETRFAAWRDRGGAIDVTEIAAVWGDLNLRGDGTVTLDTAMRPLASFSLRARGLAETARRFEQAGMIDKQVRRAIDLGVNLLSLGGSMGGEVKLPVTVQDGLLSLGPVAVAEIPPLFGNGPGPSASAAPVPSEPAFPTLAPPPTVSDDTLNASPPNAPAN